MTAPAQRHLPWRHLLALTARDPLFAVGVALLTSAATLVGVLL